MTTPPSTVRIISTDPTLWERTPFFNCLRTPSRTIAEDVQEELNDDERLCMEKWLKLQEQESKEAFLKEVRRKQFAHILGSEMKKPKGQ
jgi:hypothetical protein